MLTNKNLTVYPNPVSDLVTIETKQSELLKRIIITDLSGRIIFDNTYNDTKAVLSLSELNHGLYLLKISTDKGSYGHKLIKK